MAAWEAIRQLISKKSRDLRQRRRRIAVEEDGQNPLERYFRDVQVLRHHAFGAETRYETVGQVYLGLPPDFPALAF
jgi:hypothetical protein